MVSISRTLLAMQLIHTTLRGYIHTMKRSGWQLAYRLLMELINFLRLFQKLNQWGTEFYP